jgi:hypothetical protein
MKTLGHITCALLCGTLFGQRAAAQEGGPSREIGRTTEKEVNLVLSSSFGTVILTRGDAGKILSAEGGKQGPESNIAMDYNIRNRVGYCELTLGDAEKTQEGKHSFSLKGFDRGKWYLKLTDAVPVSFDVQLGVGRGDFDLTGLQVKDFSLSTGASDVTLAFDEPNKTVIDNLTIESGFSKFDGRNLGNAHFKHMRFQGGVGAYTLDFAGQLNTEVDVDIEVGLGVLTMYIPRNVGAQVFYEKSWASRIDCDQDFEPSGDNAYVTSNYATAEGRMNVRIDAGLGSVKIRRR